MTTFFQIMASLREQMQATLSRTDALRALIWPMGILISAILFLAVSHAPDWIMIVCVTLLVLITMLYGAAYIYFLKNDPDALRSEKYSLHKMAIEHGVYGDSRIGLIDTSTEEKSESAKSLANSRPTPETKQ